MSCIAFQHSTGASTRRPEKRYCRLRLTSSQRNGCSRNSIITRSFISDTRRSGDYYRQSNDGRILWGGRITTRQSAPLRLGQLLRGDMVSVFPQLGNPLIDFAWAGLMGYARHKMPLIGRDADGQWYATAFGGHGLNTTAMAGNLLARAIADGDDEFRRFGIFTPRWAGGLLGRAGVQGSYWWMQLRDRVDESKAENRERACRLVQQLRRIARLILIGGGQRRRTHPGANDCPSRGRCHCRLGLYRICRRIASGADGRQVTVLKRMNRAMAPVRAMQAMSANPEARFWRVDRQARTAFAKAIYGELMEAFIAVKETVENERIACHYRQQGRLLLATSPGMYDAMAREFALRREHLGRASRCAGY